MESFFIFILTFFIPLALLIGVGYGLYLAYRHFTKKTGFLSSESSAANLVYPAHFGFFLGLLLIGFNLGVYDTFGGDRVPALGLAIFQTCLAAGWLALYWQRRNWLIYTLVAVMAASGWFTYGRANGFVQSINAIMFFLSQLFLFTFMVRQYISTSLLSHVQTLLLTIPAAVRQFFVVIKDTLMSGKQHKKYSVLSWIKTLGITLLVVIFFISILSAGDPVFAELIKDIREQLVGRVLWSIFLIFVSSVILTITLPKKDDTEWELKFFSARDVSFVVGSLVTIFAIFLFVQFKYLFGGSTQLLADLGMTFSEYVRKGFVELLIATFVGGVLSYLIALKTRVNRDNKVNKWLVIGNVLMLAELGLLLVSAFKRDLLYVDTYGLTRVRIVGGLFLAWLAVFISSLLVFSMVQKFKEGRLLVVMLIATIAVWLGLNITNVDKLVAAGSPEHHEYTDYFYLSNLSEDTAQTWVDSIQPMADRVEKVTAKQRLTDIEKSELAGLKLSLISLQEKRDELFKYYATEEWLLSNSDRFVGVLENDDQMYSELKARPQESSYLSSIEETEQNLAQPKKLSQELLKQRKWQALNRSELAAYQMLEANQDIIFDQVNQLRQQIERYQITHQLSLYTQENRLLNEFTYPFITIRLNYYPHELSFATTDGYSQTLKELLRANQPSIRQIAEQCRDWQQGPVTVFGFVRFATTQRSALEGQTNLNIFDPSDQSIGLNLTSTDDDLEKAMQNSYARQVFAEMTIQPGLLVTEQSASNSAQTTKCWATLIEGKELKDLM